MSYLNDKHGAYCDTAPHYQSQTVMIKTKGSYVYLTTEQARQLAANLIAYADVVDRVAVMDLGRCKCGGELHAQSLDYGICLWCGEDGQHIDTGSYSETKDGETL